jgi:branched-chain amino acid transport system ATP-binding protein
MFELCGVDAGYGDAKVLRQVDLVVPDGSVVALVGPNGAGKTTLLRAASGLIGTTAGTLHSDDLDVTGWTPHQLVAVGIAHVPEGRGIFRSLTVRENLDLLGPGCSKADAVELGVEAFPRLGERLDQVAGTLSGGEQQMLALSRAYIARPRVVLLDEVSMGLAPMIVDAIFEFIARLAAGGASLLLVEQFVTKALGIADYAYLLHRGRVAFVGEPAELLEGDVFSRYLGSELDSV